MKNIHFCFITYILSALFVVLQLNFKCDVVLATEPVIPKVVSFVSQAFFSGGTFINHSVYQ